MFPDILEVKDFWWYIRDFIPVPSGEQSPKAPIKVFYKSVDSCNWQFEKPVFWYTDTGHATIHWFENC